MTGGPVNVRIHRHRVSGWFAQIPNDTLRDPQLSYRARGILAEVLSQPDDWHTSAQRIANLARSQRGDHGEGIWTVLTAFRELQARGYLHRKLVRGPRGRWATELHFSDRPMDDTDCRSAGSRSTERPGTDAPGTDAPGTDAPGTDAPGTDRPGTDRPGTDRPGTGQSVSSRSPQRPSTKTRTNTGQKNRSLSLGEMLRPHLPDMNDTERERLAEFALKNCRDRGAGTRRKYLRSIIESGDLPAHLADFQGNGAQPGQDRPAAGTRQGPDCPHGQPDGAGINPRSGEPWCPICRMEARELMPRAQS